MEGYFAGRAFSRFHDVHAVYGIVRVLRVLRVYCCLASFCRARPDAGLTLKSLLTVTFYAKNDTCLPKKNFREIIARLVTCEEFSERDSLFASLANRNITASLAVQFGTNFRLT
jgi:hypothetical protein